MRPMPVAWPCCSPATGFSGIDAPPTCQATVGTRQPTHQTPIKATMAMVVCPNPGSPRRVMYQMEATETRAISPQMAIFEWNGNAFPDR